MNIFHMLVYKRPFKVDEHFKLILEWDQETNINRLIYIYIPVTKMVNLAFPVRAVPQTVQSW